MSETTTHPDPEVRRHGDIVHKALMDRINDLTDSFNERSAQEKKLIAATRPNIFYCMLMAVSVTLRDFVGRDAARIDRLEKRVAELQARPDMKYCGVFQDDRAYSPGEFVTYGGSIWHCRSANAGGRPGSSASWQLAVKHGRDGRNAREVGDAV